MFVWLWYFIPPLTTVIIIVTIFHHKKVELTHGYLIMYYIMLMFGPVGFIFGLLFIKDNFTKDEW